MIRRLAHSSPRLRAGAATAIKAAKRLSAEIHLIELWTSARVAWRDHLGNGVENRPQERFLVYGQGRSGTSLLIDLMRSHPSVHCDAEIFHRWAAGQLVSPRRYIAARAALSTRPVYGCKVKIYQLTQDQGIRDPHAFLMALQQDGWRFIHLVRRNLFRKSLSLVIAESRGGKFIDRRGDSDRWLQPLTVDPARVVEVMRERQAFDQMECETLRSIDHLRIDYEDDLQLESRHQETCNRIFRFLGLSPVPVATRLVKTSSGAVSDYVENYDELATGVQDAGFTVTDPS